MSACHVEDSVRPPSSGERKWRPLHTFCKRTPRLIFPLGAISRFSQPSFYRSSTKPIYNCRGPYVFFINRPFLPLNQFTMYNISAVSRKRPVGLPHPSHTISILPRRFIGMSRYRPAIVKPMTSAEIVSSFPERPLPYT
jgi:hypothetical protein